MLQFLERVLVFWCRGLFFFINKLSLVVRILTRIFELVLMLAFFLVAAQWMESLAQPWQGLVLNLTTWSLASSFLACVCLRFWQPEKFRELFKARFRGM